MRANVGAESRGVIIPEETLAEIEYGLINKFREPAGACVCRLAYDGEPSLAYSTPPLALYHELPTPTSSSAELTNGQNVELSGNTPGVTLQGIYKQDALFSPRDLPSIHQAFSTRNDVFVSYTINPETAELFFRPLNEVLSPPPASPALVAVRCGITQADRKLVPLWKIERQPTSVKESERTGVAAVYVLQLAEPDTRDNENDNQCSMVEATLERALNLLLPPALRG